MDYYSHHLEQLKKYPDVYLKLIDLDSNSIKGILNDLLSSKINLNDEEKVRGFFKSRLFLQGYIDDSVL